MVYDLDVNGVPKSPVPDLLWPEKHHRRGEGEPFLQPSNICDATWVKYVQSLAHKIRKSHHKRGDSVKALSRKQRRTLDKVSFRSASLQNSLCCCL